MKKIGLFIAFVFTSWCSMVAQDTYYSREATLKLTGQLNGEDLHLQTSNVNVVIDYETAGIDMRFEVKTLNTEIDSLDKMLSKSNMKVHFSGKLGLEYINTANHPPLKFDLEGWLDINGSRSWIKGRGDLYHLGYSSAYSCVLSITILLDTEELNLPFEIPGIGDEFEAVMQHALLELDKN